MLLHKKLLMIPLFCLSTFVYSAAPLDILFVMSHFPVRSQIFILNIITGLIDRGHNVSIFSLHKDTPVDVHPNVEKYHLLDRVTYRNMTKKMIKKNDIIFCQFGYIGRMVVTRKNIAKCLKKKKVAVCFRGSDTTAYVENNPNGYKRLFAEGDLFLPVCDYFKKKLVAIGCPAGKTTVHYSAIDCSKFNFTPRSKPENNAINIVSVSRLVNKKGIDDVIQACAYVIQKYPQIHYFIIGDGPERMYLELLIQSLHLQDHITLCGWKSQDEVIAMLDKAHIFVLPSKKASNGDEEGIANALKESMAMGLISIGSWHAGTPELIEHGVSGFLVSENNPCQLASTIEHIIEHPEMWGSIGLAARKKIMNEFETKQSIKKLEKLFYKLL